ncbi:hypothetical protein RA19_13620 [Leisingera sp. ANG-M1]|uniref:hypothetical protein n=1 Tax=Leisingera sp. ANG-M1 TaxID=1577895 RepID=UPI00058095E7|nr:hypothetical protein [Leisingera sp. ANG-M1]KIC09809.1 hypothetical protein RA19_13620 [Leisingera sp. ANG-M1]
MFSPKTLFSGLVAALIATSAQANCNKSINIDPGKTFQQFGWVPGEGFEISSMSCTAADEMMRRFVFENDHFLSLEDLETFSVYQEKIQKMDTDYQAAIARLQGELDADVRALWVEAGFTLIGGIATAIGCVGSVGTLCAAGVVSAAGPTVYSWTEADDSVSFDLALSELDRRQDDRKALATEAGYTSMRSAYFDFVNGFCLAVEQQCAK